MPLLKELPEHLKVSHHNSQDGPHLWSALTTVYQDRGFSAGYRRGVSDTVASALAATEDFLVLRGESPADTRRLLHAFIDYFESRVRTTTAQAELVDGLGI